MELRKIELLGFKSFADATELTFDKGITAIVGPNGCGKSNVVDAIRWVLGEQSAKSLRAGAMSDCIFAGTASRKPLGFAEVTVTFDNSSGRLALPYEEVAVTRRLYGSGESEYSINRQTCRLRDVRELFMGTGVGTTAYSVIEQGEITRIISSDPKELRLVFDEAAGIALYKTRMRAATAKLERVSQNLLRVSDVLGEVEKSLRSVKYQAAKARRYQEMSARLAGLRLDRARRLYGQYSARLRELAGALADRRAEAGRLEASLAAMEAENERTAAELSALEAQIQEYSSAVARLDSEEARFRHSVELCRERIARHDQDEARLSGSLGARREELLAFETRAVELERRTARVQKRTDRLSRAAAAAIQKERQAAESERDLTVAIASTENEAIEALRAGVKLENRLSEIDAGERAAAQQKGRLAARLVELDSLAGAALAEISALSGDKKELAAQAEMLRREMGSLAEAKAAVQASAAAIDSQLKSAGERLAGVSSRRQLLEDLQKRREGVSEAARAVLDMGLPGTRGLVAELLTVPRELAVAVESVLADDAGAVVVDATSAALEAAAALASSPTGRAKVISIERAASHCRAQHVEIPGLRPLAPQVSCPAGCEPLVGALLGNCLLADDLETAVSANGQAAGFFIVTPGGEKISPDGGITAGKAGHAGGLIWRKAEIENLADEEARVRGETAALESRKREADVRLAGLAHEISGLEKSLADAATRMVQIDGRIGACETRKAEIAREKGVVANEMSALDAERAGAAAERDAVRRKIDEVHGRRAGLEEKIAELKARRTDAVDKRENARAHVTGLRVALASSLEKQSSIERQYADARGALEEKAHAVEDIMGELAAVRQAAGQERERLAAASEGIESAHREANAARVVLAARTRSLCAVREAAANLAPGLKEIRVEADAVRQALSELSISEREVSVRLQDLTAGAREELAAPPEDLALPAADADPAAADAEIEELTRKLASMGGVNMEALAELDELESRHNFLSSQKNDLVGAKESLEAIISRTRATSRKMFMESFESIREHFSAMFRRVFGGGRADCTLVDPENVLESPIQITAKPPGKEPSNLNLLSGGEKAMTAVSLLFAMFATRPSPFLVLDEVDAPLDESNIGRFLDLVSDYLPSCQFVVITHNRRTMAAADALYGITMEEEGVSKKVSVSLNSRAATPEPAMV